MADMTPEQIDLKIKELEKRTDVAAKKKAALGGQLTEKKDQLKLLIDEIKEAGFDPKTLPAERDRLQKELVADLEKYEKGLSEVETALATYESGAKK
jgi:chromosome segregation ATPase